MYTFSLPSTWAKIVSEVTELKMNNIEWWNSNSLELHEFVGGSELARFGACCQINKVALTLQIFLITIPIQSEKWLFDQWSFSGIKFVLQVMNKIRPHIRVTRHCWKIWWFIKMLILVLLKKCTSIILLLLFWMHISTLSLSGDAGIGRIRQFCDWFVFWPRNSWASSHANTQQMLSRLVLDLRMNVQSSQCNGTLFFGSCCSSQIPG